MKFQDEGVFFKKSEIEESLVLFPIKEGKAFKKDDGFLMLYDFICDLDSHNLKKINFNPNPYRIKIKSDGKLGGSSFKMNYSFLNEKSKEMIIQNKKGCFITIKDEIFVVNNSQYKIIKLIDEINLTKNDQIHKRVEVFQRLKAILPEGVVLSDESILNFEIYRIEKFTLDISDKKNFDVAPEINFDGVYRIPPILSTKFKENFLNSTHTGQGCKIGNYYIVYSEHVRKCFELIKKKNQKNISEKRGFFYNPKGDFINLFKEDSEESSEELNDLIDSMFVENEAWKSQRILHLGEWFPKAGCYIPDKNSQSEWVPKDKVSINLEDRKGINYFIYTAPENLENLEKSMKKGIEENREFINFEGQDIPVNLKSLENIKNIKNNFEQIKPNPPRGEGGRGEEEKVSKIVPIIKDNFDELVYEKEKQTKKDFSTDISYESIKTKEVYSYQKEGIRWLQENFLKGKPGVILADDMGLGKTVQVLIFLSWLKFCYKKINLRDKPTLIVAPKALLKNWEDEAKKHLQDDCLGKLFRGHGPDVIISNFREENVNRMERHGWTLTTYETLRDKQQLFREIEWGVIVFDEAQKIKNPNSLLTEMAKAMASDFSIAVTGTPVENSLIDLWCISDCVYPKKFGILKDFSKRYCKDDSNILELKKETLHSDPPFLLKRWKSIVLKGKNFPKKIIERKECLMSKEQREIYNNIIKRAQEKQYKNPFEAIHQLKRCSLYVNGNVSDEEFEKNNEKINIMSTILKEIKNENEKVLIFVKDRIFQMRLIEYFKNKFSIDPFLINGELSAEERSSVVNKFNSSSGFNILLISPKAGGVGLTITSANHVIHLEREWNPAVEDQCTDRAYRIGQEKNVKVYLLISEHPDLKSFDRHLDELLENKRKKLRDVITPSELSDFDKKKFYEEVTHDRMSDYKQDSFYMREDWKNLRKQARMSYPNACMRCGSVKDLHVDHIKPRSKYPHLELEFKNLQILCESCNLKKGSKDSDEWNFLT